MRIPLRQSSTLVLPGTTGAIRADRRVSALLRRVQPGDIAVLDHLDLDRDTARALLDRGVAAVVNASPFISGRYPNLGPELLASAGVVLVDGVGPDAFAQVRDGAAARVHDGVVYVGEEPRLLGRELDLDTVHELMDLSRQGLAAQLQSFTHNTTEFLRHEQDLLLHGQGVPDLRTPMRGRPVVVVERGHDHESDLRRIRRFVREQRPVLVGVDSGADALRKARLRPDLVVVGAGGLGGADGDPFRVVSDRALAEAGEVLLHVDGSAPAGDVDRLDRLGVHAERVTAGGATEDVALLVADLQGASVLVSVGGHATLDEFLDRQRAGLASTFLTRLRVGPRLVDARSVPALYAGRVRLWQLLLVLVAGLLAVAVAVAATPRGGTWMDDLGARGRSLVDQVRELGP